MLYGFTPVTACEMCGSGDFRHLGLRLNRSQGVSPRSVSGIAVSVKRCRSCGLVFSDPRPSPVNLGDHYGVRPEDYWRPGYFEESPHYFAKEIATARELLGSGRLRALDIGAGIGKGVRAMQRAGFDAYGLEPSPTFREIALQTLSPGRILPSTVEEADLSERFDFITFGAVLEHLQEPGRAIEKALRWLNPGGLIHAEVPSSHHLMSKVVNGYFRLRGVNYVTNLSPMHPPYHLYEFSPASFERHGAVAGYRIELLRRKVCSIFHLPKAIHPPLRWLMEKTHSGMQISVWLRPAPPET